MAAASNKRMTKEKIEVNDKNKKENESVFESNASGKSRQKTSRAGASKKAGHQTAAKTTTRKKTPVKIDITHQRKIQDVTEYRDRLAFETGITLIVIGIVAVFLYISFFWTWRSGRKSFWWNLLWIFRLGSMVYSSGDIYRLYIYDGKQG